MKIPTRISCRIIDLSSLLLFALSTPLVVAQQNQASQPVGRLLASDPVSIEGHVDWTTAMLDSEEPAPTLLNGNKLAVQKGIALLDLNQFGGWAGFCGRTTVSVVVSKSSILCALQGGTVSLDLNSTAAIRVLTAEVSVEWKRSEAPAKKQGVVSTDSRGALCVQNFAGSLRASDQLTGATMEIPEGTSIQFVSGGINNPQFFTNLACGCSRSTASAPDTSGIHWTGPSAAGPVPGNTREGKTETGAPLQQENVTKSLSDSSLQKIPTAAISETRTSPATETTFLESTTASPIASAPAKNEAAKSEGLVPPSGVFAVSADSFHRPAEKKSLGQKVKGFFQHIFSRKPRPNPDEEEK